VQCDIWDITAYLLLPELKYYCKKEIDYHCTLATGNNPKEN
jgi:hypothetical protein